MKIELETINILKNFSKINPSILIEGGNIVRTISPNHTIMAKAVVNTDFPKRFALYNLDRFISVYSLFNNPELVFEDSFVSIQDGHKKTNYFYTDENTIKKIPGDKKLVFPQADVKFNLTNDKLREVEKALGVLGLPEIIFVGNGDTISIQAADSKSGGDFFSIDIGKTDKTFKAIFKSENIKIIPDEYEVSICSRGISWFVGNNVEYWIAVESNSEF